MSQDRGPAPPARKKAEWDNRVLDRRIVVQKDGSRLHGGHGEDEKSGSQAYVPPDETKDKQLIAAAMEDKPMRFFLT